MAFVIKVPKWTAIKASVAYGIAVNMAVGICKVVKG